MKRIGMIIVSLLLIGNGLMAQENVGELLKEYGTATQHDINKLANAYLKPYGETLGTSLNAGWYTSAAPHKLLGFDFTFMASYTMVPSSAKTFDVSKLNLEAFTLKTGSGSIAPTMSGSMSSSKRPVLTPNTSVYTGADLALPNGSGATAMITPMLQAAVGLPFHSEVMVRFMPKVELPDYGSLGLWGVGFKHSLKDYIPFVKRVPFLQLSLLGAYTNFTSNLAMANSTYLTNGKLDITSNAYTGRLLIGANFPLVAFYTGLGYGNANSTFDVSGNLNNGVSPATDGKILSLAYDKSNFDANVGMRLRLGLIALHADYSVGDYQMITAGVGLSFR